jgi:hypothetical protein
MLQAHSFLWHYLWIAPNVYLLVLALLIRQRALHRTYPTFFIFCIVAGIEQLTVYAADVLPWISPSGFWYVLWGGLLIEAVVKFILIGELFVRIFGPYPSIARLGGLLIRGIGVALVFLAALAAAFSPMANIYFLVSGSHLLEQTVYIVELGLLLFIFAFCLYFGVRSERIGFGICLGLALSACVHLSTWAFANGNLSRQVSVWLDLINMATYHVCVLIWAYYFLVPAKVVAHATVTLPDHNLELWNRELERLLQ